MRGYNTLSDDDKKIMLGIIGVDSIEDLFQSIPEELKLKRALDLPDACSEWELESKMQSLSQDNINTSDYLSFLGAGKYNHNVPSVISAIVNRGEFLTSYTPYQPEMSQGLLQALYEYQLVMSKITGLEVVNSSSYDGATAMTDAAWVCCSIKNTKKILVAGNIWKEYREVLNTYMLNRNIEITAVDFNNKTGEILYSDLEEKLKINGISGFIFQSPNAFGVMEDMRRISTVCDTHNVLSSVSINPMAQGLFESPGKHGVDIVTGEGQPLGMHLNAGGSSLGIFSTRKKFRKYVPGRLIGKVTDIKGNLAYSLVFEDREQHVAREKATSNICSNQALNAIRAGIYLSYTGEMGFQNIAKINAAKAEYLLNKLLQIKGVEQRFSGNYFNEFVISLPVDVSVALKKMREKKIFGGVNYKGMFCLDNELLVSVTEKLSKDNLESFVDALKGAL